MSIHTSTCYHSNLLRQLVDRDLVYPLFKMMAMLYMTLTVPDYHRYIQWSSFILLILMVVEGAGYALCMSCYLRFVQSELDHYIQLQKVLL